MPQSLRAEEIYPGVTIAPTILQGKPVITGTRVLVSQIVGHLAAGDTIETVCDAYDLTPEQDGAAGAARLRPTLSPRSTPCQPLPSRRPLLVAQ